MSKPETKSRSCHCHSTLPGNQKDCCCPTQAVTAKKSTPWIYGGLNTAIGTVPTVTTRLSSRDFTGAVKVRCGIGRMHYQVPPGLYAVGNPDPAAPVLVSANYKLSFDRLRRELNGFNLWILVVDTKGINVWCAAGKGTFGTGELVRRIEQTRLSQVVTGRTLILPQLAAPGVAAHEVLQRSGFKVVYGPVRAADLPEFLQAGLKATPQMRQVRFGLGDRLVLAPIELVNAVKPGLLILAVLLILNLTGAGARSVSWLLGRTWTDFLPYLGAILVGAVLFPALLPYLPGRAFSFKGWFLGLVWAVIYMEVWGAGGGWSQTAIYLCILPAIVSFLAMNFTGSSTFTSLSGVVREMRWAVPAQIISAGLGVVILIGRLIFGF